MEEDNFMLGLLSAGQDPVTSHDLLVMFAAFRYERDKAARLAVNQKLLMYKKQYTNFPDFVWTQMEEILAVSKESEMEAKRILSEYVNNHPLAQRLCKIQRFSPHRLGSIMGHIRYPERFRNPSALCVYAGVSCKNGVALSMSNYRELNEMKKKSFQGLEEEFKSYGHHTRLAKEMYLAAKTMLASKSDRSWFRDYYDRQKQRLIDRAKSQEEAFEVNRKFLKENKGKGYELGKWYMKDRKKFSLNMWAHSGALRRMQKVLLHLVYTEWMEIRGIPAKNPYPVEYIDGCRHLIRLEEILKYENEGR